MSTDIALPKVPDGTILLVGVRYNDSPKVFSYAMLKAGGRWYVTGSGPQDAGWAAVQRWLGKDGRMVESVEVLTDKQLIWSRSRPVTAEPHHPCSACQCGSDECPGAQVHSR